MFVNPSEKSSVGNRGDEPVWVWRVVGELQSRVTVDSGIDLLHHNGSRGLGA